MAQAAAPRTPDWRQKLLGGVNAPVTPDNLRLLTAWQHAEGGTATNNPFNTTQSSPGATNYNSVGVKNYGSPDQGLAATVATLQNGRYDPVLSALRSGNNAAGAANAVVQSPWGTGPNLMSVLGSTPAPHAAPIPHTTPIPAAVAGSPQLGNAAGNVAQGLTSRRQFAQGLLGSLGNDGQITNLGGLTAALTQRRASMQAQAPSDLARPLQQAGQTVGYHPKTPTVQVEGQPTQHTDKALDLVREYLGTPYSWGGGGSAGPSTGIGRGATTKGFDCSGLLQFYWAKRGVNIPRTTYDQVQAGTPVDRQNLQPGDAVFFTGSDPKNGLPGHVGIFIGGGQFIEAPGTGDVVKISQMSGRSDFVGGRRYG